MEKKLFSSATIPIALASMLMLSLTSVFAKSQNARKKKKQKNPYYLSLDYGSAVGGLSGPGLSLGKFVKDTFFLKLIVANGDRYFSAEDGLASGSDALTYYASANAFNTDLYSANSTYVKSAKLEIAAIVRDRDGGFYFGSSLMYVTGSQEFYLLTSEGKPLSGGEGLKQDVSINKTSISFRSIQIGALIGNTWKLSEESEFGINWATYHVPISHKYTFDTTEQSNSIRESLDKNADRIASSSLQSLLTFSFIRKLQL